MMIKSRSMKQSQFSRVLFVFMFFGGPALAQELVLTTTVGIDAFHDDQYDLQVEGSEVDGFVYRPNIGIGYQSQRYQSMFSFGAVYNRFVSSGFEDSTNLNLGWDQRLVGESSVKALNIDYSERLVEDLVELDDSPGVPSSEIVKTVGVQPSYSRTLSELTRVELSYQYAETIIEDSDALENDSNIRHSVVLGWERTYSPRSTFGLYADYLASRPQASEGETEFSADIYGLAIGGVYRLSERWGLEGAIGANVTEIDEDVVDAVGEQVVVDNGDVIFTSNVTANFTGRRNSVTLGLNAGTTQQLDGVVDNQQLIDIAWTRQYSDLLSSSVSGSYFHAERNDRNNYVLEASLRWQPALRWQYRFSYGYRKQSDITSTDQSIAVEALGGESNRITITLDYTFEDLRFEI